MGLGKCPSSAPAGMGSNGAWQRVGRVGEKRSYFRIEWVRKVWHVSGFYQSSARNECQKSELVVEGMSKDACPKGIAGS